MPLYVKYDISIRHDTSIRRPRIPLNIRGFAHRDKSSPSTQKDPSTNGCGSFSYSVQTALVTLPERRQREHTYTVLGVPLTTALTRLIFGFQVLFVLRFECETARPKATALPQISHFAITCTSLNSIHDITILFYQKE